MRDRTIISKKDPEKKSPLGKVLRAAHYTAGGGYPVYGWPNEIGQIQRASASPI
jgi:hypothetical protein